MNKKKRSRSRRQRFLSPSAWPSAIKLGFIFALGVSPVLLTFAIAPILKLTLCASAWINLGVATLLTIWYAIDVVFIRREIYHFLGYEEDPIKPAIRFWRKLLLLTSAFVGLLFMAYGRTEGFSVDGLTPIYVLSGAYFAGIGWMYTAFESEKAGSVAHAYQAIRDQLFSDYLTRNYRAIVILVTHCRDAYGNKPNEPLPVEAMDLNIGTLHPSTREGFAPAITLRFAVDQFLNALDAIAFGVRQGQLDYLTVEMVLRNRYVRHAFVFSNYIKNETNAVRDTKSEAYRSTDRTWEHFLWLTSRYTLFDDDEVDPSYLVLPPNAASVLAKNRIAKKSKSGEAPNA